MMDDDGYGHGHGEQGWMMVGITEYHVTTSETMEAKGIEFSIFFFFGMHPYGDASASGAACVFHGDRGNTITSMHGYARGVGTQ